MESNEMILIHTVEKFVKAAQNDQYLFDCLPDFLSALKEAIKHDASIKSWGTDTDFDRIAAAFIANLSVYYDLGFREWIPYSRRNGIRISKLT